MERLSLENIISALYEDEDYFYRKIGYLLTCDEYDYLKTLIPNKSCSNCQIKTCDDKSHVCMKWRNNVMVGKAKIKEYKL